MVRSSGHHRKRSPSRSLSPSDHKRVKSSHRDREKERSRRRSRSRDRIRRSRSRDRKDRDKRISDSRVRSKPLKLKRRSRSRSRSRSREHTVKKEEKKEVKVDDEPFDPTNLDKQKNLEESALDEDWIITDMVQENTPDEDDNVETMPNNDVSENSFVSNRLYNETQNNHEEDKVNNNEGPDTSHHRSNSRTSESSESHSSNHNRRHYEKGRSLHITNGVRNKHLSRDNYSSKVARSRTDLEIEQAREFHQLRMRNEKEKHLAEMELIKLQTVYWQLKCSKSASVSEYSCLEAEVAKYTNVEEVIGSGEQVFEEKTKVHVLKGSDIVKEVIGSVDQICETQTNMHAGSDINVKEVIDPVNKIFETETQTHVQEGSDNGVKEVIGSVTGVFETETQTHVHEGSDNGVKEVIGSATGIFETETQTHVHEGSDNGGSGGFSAFTEEVCETGS